MKIFANLLFKCDFVLNKTKSDLITFPITFL